MASETQTRTGNCPTQRTVEATPEMPKPGFPIFVYASRRILGNKRPYICPDCGAPVTTG
jgi:hypothetical protein